MNWEKLLTSPPPETGWDLGTAQAAVVHRTGPEELHCAVEDVPPGAFEVGPVGLQAVDREALAPVLTRLKGAAEGTTTAAVVVPTGWLRAFLLEADKLPRRESEVLDVIRWRLKKLLPVAPADLRLSVIRVGEAEGRRQVMVLAGIERAVLSLSGPGVQIERDTATAIRNAKSANDFLGAEIQKRPHRYSGFAHLAMQDAKAAADAFDKVAEAAGIQYETRSVESIAGEGFMEAVRDLRVTDLVVVSQDDPDRPEPGHGDQQPGRRRGRRRHREVLGALSRCAPRCAAVLD